MNMSICLGCGGGRDAWWVFGMPAEGEVQLLKGHSQKRGDDRAYSNSEHRITDKQHIRPMQHHTIVEMAATYYAYYVR